jgi:hypothetical protein
MLDAFKKLVESGAISEDVQSVIESAWTKKIQENRDQVTAELREEFANRYEHDKGVIVEAVNKMVSERLVQEMAELAEDRKSLVEAREQYRRKMVEDAKTLQSFMVNSLSKELVEFRNDRERVAENFAKVEQFVVNALAREIHEFAQDKRDLAETKVKLVREAKNKFDEIKKQFITKSSVLVKEAVTQTLVKEISQLKEDIDSARRVDFGRRLFEAFAQEYSNSYLNEKSETSKLLKIIEKKDLAIAEAKQALTEKQKLVESKEREVRVQRDLVERKNVMGELLAPLSAEQKRLMQQLLESVKTDKLHVAFDKYLPAVMEGNTKKVKVSEQKETLTESTEITGDRKAKPEVGLDNILEIRKLAGLSK